MTGILQTLLAFSSGRHRLTPCPLAFGENDVKSRVKEVLSYRKAPFWIILTALILGAAAAVILLTVPPKGADGFWQDGLVLQCENELTMMLLQDKNAKTETPCTLGNLTEEDQEALAKLETGRKISIRTDMIMESYPAQVQVKGLRISEDETLQEVDAALVSQLRSMGYLIILPGETSGLPDFEFSLEWGPYGVSSYDSDSGELIMNREENNPEKYTAVHQLTDEERRKVWALLISLPYDAYPEDYKPNPNAATEPETRIVLSVTADGKTHTTRTTDGALIMDDSVEAGVQNGAKAFAKVIRELENLLMETPEWQAFPEPEVYYE